MIRKVPMVLKKKRCCICHEETFLYSKGRCKPCAMKQGKKPTLKVTNTTPKTTKVKPKNKLLDTFFEKNIEKLYKLRVSEESGAPIPFPTRVNIAHLFPKRNHKSVETHELNCIYLTWDEHTTLDSKYLDRLDFKGLKKGFPNSFQLIIERMRVVRKDITEKTNMVEAFDKFNDTLDF